MQSNVRLQLEYTLEGEDMRNDLALPGMLGSIAGIEDISVDGEERVVVIALQTSTPVSVNDVKSVWVGDRHVVRSEPYEGPCKTTRRDGSAPSHIWNWGRF